MSLNKLDKHVYYYGFNFTLDRHQSYNGRALERGRNFAKTFGINGSTGVLNHIDAFTYLKVPKTDDTYRSYVPTMRLYRSYVDYAYDISVFGNQLVYEGLAANVEDAMKVYEAADPDHSSSWIYRVNPEYSLGIKALSGSDSISKNVLEDDYLGYASGGSAYLTSLSDLESARSVRPAAHQFGKNWKWDETLIRNSWLGVDASDVIGASDVTGVGDVASAVVFMEDMATLMDDVVSGVAAFVWNTACDVAVFVSNSITFVSNGVTFVSNSVSDLIQGIQRGFVAFADATSRTSVGNNGVSQSTYQAAVKIILNDVEKSFGDNQQVYEYAVKTCLQYLNLGSRHSLWEAVKDLGYPGAYDRIYNNIYKQSLINSGTSFDQVSKEVPTLDREFLNKVDEAVQAEIAKNPSMTPEQIAEFTITIMDTLVYAQKESEAGASAENSEGEGEYRAYSSVWVADNGDFEVDYESGDVSNAADVLSASTTVAFKDMYNKYAENDVYSMSVVYNPNMSALESWQYRLFESYEDDVLIDALNAGGIGGAAVGYSPEDIIKDNKNTTHFSDRLDDGREKLESFSVLEQIDVLDEADGYALEWDAASGWSMFDSSSLLVNVSGSPADAKEYELTGDAWKQNLNYISLNVASMLIYGDLGTLDVYYTTDFSPKIIDIQVEVVTADDPTDVKISTIRSNVHKAETYYKLADFQIEQPPSESYDMVAEAPNRKCYPIGEYTQTIVIRADTLEELVEKTENIGDLWNELLNPTLTHEDMGEIVVVNLKEEIQEDPTKQLVFVNVWVDAIRPMVYFGTNIIRKDEITAAQIIEVPAKVLRISQDVVKRENCGNFEPLDPDTTRGAYLVDPPDPVFYEDKPYTVHPHVVMMFPHTFLRSNNVLNDVYTVVGTGNIDEYSYDSDPKLRYRWEKAVKTAGTLEADYYLPMSGQDLVASTYSAGSVRSYFPETNPPYTFIEWPNSPLYVTMICHRSGLSYGNVRNSKTPPLAAYMNVTEENKDFLDFADLSDLPVVSVWDSTRIFQHTDAYGYTRAGNATGMFFQNLELKYGTVGRVTTINETVHSYRAKHFHTWVCVEKYEYLDYSDCGSCTGCTDGTGCDDPDENWIPTSHTHKAPPAPGHKSDAEYGEWNDITTGELYKTASGSWASTPQNLNHTIYVEGTYIAKRVSNPRDLDLIVKAKKAKVKADRTAYDYGTFEQDEYVEYYIPTKLSFYPTYQMRADYAEDRYEINGAPQYAGDQVGNIPGNNDREIVWTLGKNIRDFVVHDYHYVGFDGDAKTEVLAPWSTDKHDKDEASAEGPTVKAGGAIKAKANTSKIEITSVISIIDPAFAEDKDAQKAENNAKLMEHNYLVDKVLSMGNNLRDTGSYAFLYSSLPGSYDVDMVNSGHDELYNPFQNYINGYVQYPDDIMNGNTPYLEQTRLSLSENTADMVAPTTVTAYYLNKEFEDSDFTNGPLRTRWVEIQADAVGLAPAINKTLIPQLYTGVNETIAGKTLEEITSGAQQELEDILETGSGSHWNWYKEDYEGIVVVVMKTTVEISLEGDYSIVWPKLSDWRDLDEVEPYVEELPRKSGSAMPAEVVQEFIDGGSVDAGASVLGFSSRIPSGGVGLGYGLMTDDVTLRGVSYGKLALLYEPYKFRVRAAITDDINR